MVAVSSGSETRQSDRGTLQDCVGIIAVTDVPQIPVYSFVHHRRFASFVAVPTKKILERMPEKKYLYGASVIIV
jgi:hypothetical protein